MALPVLLAHGALGIWDEVIFLSIAAVFIVMMGISWLRSRGADTDADDPPPAAEAQTDLDARPDHFRLD